MLLKCKINLYFSNLIFVYHYLLCPNYFNEILYVTICNPYNKWKAKSQSLDILLLSILLSLYHVILYSVN
ncbi:hypothetical protein C2G38_2101967 [Gigaspora rosea]|uniref:Uncharacterized protein n=1 Tax=Gigaspora rosea TaxID=44941 RepID=A0A397UPE8_9GLOM|nr:hypothetical protein C2G38_2101967 [Gigaspora rosea]